MFMTTHPIEKVKENDLKVLYNSNNSIIQDDISKKDNANILNDKYKDNSNNDIANLDNVKDIFSKPSESVIIDTTIEDSNIRNKLKEDNEKRIYNEKRENISRVNDITKKAIEKAQKIKEEKEKKERAEKERKERAEREAKAKREALEKEKVLAEVKNNNKNIIDITKIKGKKIKVELTGFSDPETVAGIKPHDGTIAVPYEIPLGTKIYIPGYGVCTAEDRGSAIKIKKDGTYKIDIWKPTAEKAWDVGLVQSVAYVIG